MGKIICRKYSPVDAYLGNAENEKKMSSVDLAFLNLFVDSDYCNIADRKIKGNRLGKDLFS
jgi:hypothetical protein